MPVSKASVPAVSGAEGGLRPAGEAAARVTAYAAPAARPEMTRGLGP